MAFCIECGAKAPDVAKFCPQCGVALVQVETVSEPAPAPVVMTPEVETPKVEMPEGEEIAGETLAAAELVETETPPEEIEPDGDTPPVESASIDVTPSAAASLAAAASVDEDTPKSKAGLFMGLAITALLAAGGGAYALGLFGGGDKETEILATVPDVTKPAAIPETAKPEISTTKTVLASYQEAIKTGRISDLGQFAKDNPDSSLAKDAETAAFTSLQRQGSELAYKTFTSYFPEADMTAYSGPRINDGVNVDETTSSTEAVLVELDAPAMIMPSIRTSITKRAEGLEPFIAQGNADYVLSVIDEMAAMAGLTDEEAVYLLNLSERAETSRILAAPAQTEFIQPDTVEPGAIVPNAGETITEPVLETQICWDGRVIAASAACPPTPDTDATAVVTEASAEGDIEAAKPEPKYDTAAKPLERLGAETPEAATEPGECDMFFDITASGAPTNIDASCSDPLFVAPAKDAVSDWVYEPALLNGVEVQQNDLQVKIRFNLE